MMENALSFRQHGWLYPQARAARPGMTACSVAGIVVGVLVLGIILSQVPDLIRYVRMSSM